MLAFTIFGCDLQYVIFSGIRIINYYGRLRSENQKTTILSPK